MLAPTIGQDHFGKVPYKNGGPQIKLFCQLSDVDVYRHQLLCIHLLNFSYDIRHPLKLMLSPCHPDKIHLEEDLAHFTSLTVKH